MGAPTLAHPSERSEVVVVSSLHPRASCRMLDCTPMNLGLAVLAQPAAAREAAGRRNRLYAEQHFDQRKILAGHEAFLLDAIAASKGR